MAAIIDNHSHFRISGYNVVQVPGGAARVGLVFGLVLCFPDI
jgi:hypothetical protein